MRRAAAVVGAVLVALLAPLVVVLVGVWAKGWTVASVTTGSMQPGTPAGSMVVLAPVSPADIGVGDVIGYRHDGLDAVVTHRVVEVLDQPGGRYFTTLGDANRRPDVRPVPARDVVGEVRWRIAGLGTLAEALRDPRVQGALIGVPLVLLLVSEALGVRERRASVLIVALRAEIARLEAQLESVGATPRPSPWRQLASALGFRR